MSAANQDANLPVVGGKALLKALAVPGTMLMSITEGRRSDEWYLVRGGKQLGRSVAADEVRDLLSSGRVRQQGDGLVLSGEGRLALRRLLSAGEGFHDQHREVVARPFPADGAGEAVYSAVNLKESPLGWLASRKDRKGKALLDKAQVEAGERLRADYDFARLQPALAGGWRVEPNGAARGGGLCPATDLGDDVIAARQRVTRTLTEMEPVLASVVVDVCCHLKGLEKVEAERGWPARSGKVVLQIALSSLADRYGMRTVAPDGQGRIRAQRQV
ncbi:DUF6456 domain-containing protein [Roseibium sp.]|uniref:DUF6456 domain-containing protein n=1 Tax=Roseibium sp. TaxID=1936156 RepID=UPI003A985F44